MSRRNDEFEQRLADAEAMIDLQREEIASLQEALEGEFARTGFMMFV